MKSGGLHNVIFISFSQFGVAFSFQFVYIFLPFYVAGMSQHSPQATLLWVGAIMGSTSLCLALTSPACGSLAHRFRPKSLYVAGMVIQATLFLVFGFATTLPGLLILRMLQGAFGGISTIGLIIISLSSSEEKRAFHFGIFQSGISLGQLIGPSLGVFAVAAFGYQWAFISASLILFASSLFCYMYVTPMLPLPSETKSSIWSTLDKRVLTGAMLLMTATTHLGFLPSVLPQVFERFGLDQATALRWAGPIVMFYTATSMIGTYAWSYLSRRIGVRRMTDFLLLSGVVLPALLAFTNGLASFTIVVMLEMGMVAAIVPLAMSIFAAEPKGNVIGFLNSSRFVAMALGPMLATSLVAFANLPTLYLCMSGITLATYLVYKVFLK
jgi:DHA1 family multidrug resistance protein-like MFS transporter